MASRLYRRCYVRVSYKSVKEDCRTRVSSESVLQECQVRVSRKEGLARMSNKSVLQE